MMKPITNKFRKKLDSGLTVCDGAMGTAIQERGLKTGEMPETLNISRPELIKDIHKEYIEAGADIVTTNTFGANEYKMPGSEHDFGKTIKAGVDLALEAVGETGKDDVCVALGLGPTGMMMEPVGDLSFDTAYDIFKSQITFGAEADLILLETFSDIGELRTAVLACKENSDLPVVASCTFEEDGRMLLGTDPLTAVTILQDLGVSAIGLNCSLGPKEIIPIFREFADYSRIPLIVQPNAGLPRDNEGTAVYDIDVPEFLDAMIEMTDMGAQIIGGCCGTNAEYIRALRELADGINKKSDCATEQTFSVTNAERGIHLPCAASASRTVVFDEGPIIVGERINPTGKKKLKEAIENDDYAYVEDEALAQAEDGADILEINVGMPDIDESAVLAYAVKRISSKTAAPLMIDSKDASAIENAIRSYAGSPVINSVSGEQKSMDEILPLVKHYGTSVVALTLDERGLPKTVEERFEILEKILDHAGRMGIGRHRILVDFLTLTVSAEPSAPKDTLEAVKRARSMGIRTILGASNVSFGLPNRPLLNETFLSMAFGCGLTAAITDPTAYKGTLTASKTLLGKDKEAGAYICYNEKKDTSGGDLQAAREGEGELSLEEAILKGFDDRAADIASALSHTEAPLDIIEKRIIPTLGIIGDRYDSGEIFLPQMIRSADTVKAAFAVLREKMREDGTNMDYGRIILATVQGDIHDIGKNIVKAILENYGYDIIDLGKDVPIEKVVETAKLEKIRMVGLSALMTTTVVNMKKTIDALNAENVDCVIAVGGAVLNAAYADKIGADHYCETAMDTVRVANSIFKER